MIWCCRKVWRVRGGGRGRAGALGCQVDRMRLKLVSAKVLPPCGCSFLSLFFYSMIHLWFPLISSWLRMFLAHGSFHHPPRSDFLLHVSFIFLRSSPVLPRLTVPSSPDSTFPHPSVPRSPLPVSVYRFYPSSPTSLSPFTIHIIQSSLSPVYSLYV